MTPFFQEKPVMRRRGTPPLAWRAWSVGVAGLWVGLFSSFAAAQNAGAPSGPAAARPSSIAVAPNRVAVGSSDAVTTFVKANEAYEAGRYDEAARAYEALLVEAPTAQLYYNLGNALLRAGSLGGAIAAYRRAQLLAPRDADLRANLAFARQTRKDALVAPEPSAVWRTVFFWHYSLSRSELWLVAALANLGLFALAMVRLWRRDSEILRWLMVSCAVVVALALGSQIVHGVAPERVAVIREGAIEARSGLGQGTVVRFVLHDGAEVKVVDEQDGWLRIVLPDGQQGWIDGAQAALIEG